ncbi:hypothetical protein pb186bvf_002191 [Paramecium bursaria]
MQNNDKLTHSASMSQFSSTSSKPKLVNYFINKKQQGLGQRIVRQHVELQQQNEEKPTDTVKSLKVPTRTETRQSHQSRKSENQETVQTQPRVQSNLSKRPITIDTTQKFRTQESIYPGEELFSEYQFIDEIPLDHPIWKQILPDDPNINIPKLIAENPEYFQHILGFCSCYKCSCGQCKCNFAKNVKINATQTHASVYGKDFNFNQCQYNQLLPLNQTFYSTKFNDQQVIDLQSQHRHNFRVNKNQVQQSLRPSSREHKGDFIGNSSYRTFYNNWGPPDTHFFKRPHHISVSDQIPFVASSLYQDSFNSRKLLSKTENCKNITDLTPLPTGQQFLAKTQNQIAYQPFKILQQPKLNKEFPIFDKPPRYDGQFKKIKLLPCQTIQQIILSSHK